MSEQETAYKKELFSGALHQIEELDIDWRIDSAALQLQHANAVYRKEQYEREVERLEQFSKTESKRHHEIRDSLTKTAIALALRDDEVCNRDELFDLTVQVVEGQFHDDQAKATLVKNLKIFDQAVDTHAPIVHIANGDARYALLPDSTKRSLDLTSSPRGNGISIDMPYDTMVDKDKVFTGGKMSLNYPLSVTEDKKSRPTPIIQNLNSFFQATPKIDHAFIVGSKALHSLFHDAGGSHYYTNADVLKEKMDFTYDVWKKASTVSDEFKEHGNTFYNQAFEPVSSSMAKQITNYLRQRENVSLTLPQYLITSLLVIKKAGKIGTLKESVLTDYYKQNSYMSPEVLNILMDEMIQVSLG